VRLEGRKQVEDVSIVKTTHPEHIKESYPQPGGASTRQVIKPQTGWRLIDWHELWQYRDLLYFLVWRDIKTRYAQSVLGIGWALIQPLFTMIIFTVIFGRIAQVPSDGIPYPLFSYAALVPWTYFANALNDAGASLVSGSKMITKVYFPRVVLPLAAVLGKLIDFGIASILLFILMAWYQVWPTSGVVLLPVLLLVLMVAAAGVGMWLTALAIQYRDVKYGLSFAVSLLIYVSPVIYPISALPQQYRLLYGLNPMVGVIEGFRSALLGTMPMPWDVVLVSTLAATAVFVSGMFYFRRMEKVFADVA
jgi:lipopolysaccharide transport system permease protein